MEPNIPSFNSPVNYQQELTQSVSSIAPLATSWHGAQNTPFSAGPQFVNNSPAPSQGSAISQFGHFLGGVFSETGHLAEGAAKWLGTQTLNMVEAPFKFGASVGHDITDYMNLRSANQTIDQHIAQLQTLNQQYQSGRISHSAYTAALHSLMQDESNTSNLVQSLNTKINQDATDTRQSGINTVADLVTILTAGFGKATETAVTLTGGKVGLQSLETQSAADFLKSKAADAYLTHVEPAINKIASDSTVFNKLSSAAQFAVQKATADVVSQGTNLTANQIARATVSNLALKYPIFYNYLSTTGDQLYKELDQKKYGDAVRTLAFNAALSLAGGPIGWAMKHGGDAVKAISVRTFTQTPFLDTLSRMVGNGDPQGFYNAVMKLSPEERVYAARGLSAVEATNLAAVGGNDATAAALRVVKGMRSQYEALGWNQLTHDQALTDMVRFAKNQQIADTWGKTLKKNLTVGRLDVRDKTVIAKQLAEAPPEMRTSIWEQMKQANPNEAWANNANFDRQIQGLIGKYSDGQNLGAAIQNIKATTAVPGIPKSVTSEMAKDGYVIIQPSKLEAPFVEGSGKITSTFAPQTTDIFNKAVTPLPILSNIGDALTRLGLSPNASTSSVYEMFNAQLADNLKNTSAVFHDLAGESASQQTDSLIKKLSSYAHDPTRRGLANKTPIIDLRMMTNKDIQAALGVSSTTAKEVQNAISRAYIQIPLTVRGLGDRAVDLVYRTPGAKGFARRFFRLQGAARFAWNPFFQYLRLVPKTEILASAEGGGYINAIFQGKAGEINTIRSYLRNEVGAFDEAAHGGLLSDVVSGEATAFEGATGRNLTKKLLPAQERSIAGLVSAQADRMGMDWKSYVDAYPQNVRDTVQAIAQYDRNANFINSPLARTLNIAFFPFRFDAKVLGILAKGVARQQPLMQLAIINGLYKAHSWLNSPEGQVWYSKNADAIGVFNYITPTATFAEVFSSLMPGHDHSLGNFGELGGLPFGWIPQILDSEGLTHFSQPYVTAKGVEIPDYVPATTKAQAAIAIQDFIGSLFSYPGATAGLPSKTKITRTLANGLTSANSSDYTKVLRPLSPEQQAYIKNVATNPATPKPVAPQPLQAGTNVPQGSTPLETAVPRKTSTGSGKKKKSQFKPELLPGQTTYGQL